MDVSRRAFLKAAAIAASMTSVLPFGKAAAVPYEQTQEVPWMYDRDGQLCWRWDWTLGPWERGRRLWRTMLIVPNHSRAKILLAMRNNALCTNQRAFCGVRKDCLLLDSVNWKTSDGVTLATVYLKEHRRAYGYANIIDASTGKRIKGRWRIYERANFHEIMPGLHSFPSEPAFPRGDWIDLDVMDWAREAVVRLLGSGGESP